MFRWDAWGWQGKRLGISEWNQQICKVLSHWRQQTGAGGYLQIWLKDWYLGTCFSSLGASWQPTVGLCQDWCFRFLGHQGFLSEQYVFLMHGADGRVVLCIWVKQRLKRAEKAWSPPPSATDDNMWSSNLGTHLESSVWRTEGCIPWAKKGVLRDSVLWKGFLVDEGLSVGKAFELCILSPRDMLRCPSAWVASPPGIAGLYRWRSLPEAYTLVLFSFLRSHRHVSNKKQKLSLTLRCCLQNCTLHFT